MYLLFSGEVGMKKDSSAASSPAPHKDHLPKLRFSCKMNKVVAEIAVENGTPHVSLL